MPGSSTTPGRPSACVGALGHIAFHYTDSVGTRRQFSIAAQWLACTFPCRRFADILTDAGARLGADVVRYSFIVVDLHHLLLAGLPAHLCKNAATRDEDRINEALNDTSRFVGRRSLSGRSGQVQTSALAVSVENDPIRTWAFRNRAGHFDPAGQLLVTSR